MCGRLEGAHGTRLRRSMLPLAAALLLAVPGPTPPQAKAPGLTHCYKGVCHKVLTIEQTRLLIGRTMTITTSYYGSAGAVAYTSNGDRFDANDPARVASSDLPDGTELLVRNPANGRVSHVRVNDFGPFRGNRRLDVTRRIAEDLDFRHRGVVPLEVTVIAAPEPADLTYRRERPRQAMRGHLGVVFDAEMPATIAGLVAERGTPTPAEALVVVHAAPAGPPALPLARTSAEPAAAVAIEPAPHAVVAEATAAAEVQPVLGTQPIAVAEAQPAPSPEAPAPQAHGQTETAVAEAVHRAAEVAAGSSGIQMAEAAAQAEPVEASPAAAAITVVALTGIGTGDAALEPAAAGLQSPAEHGMAPAGPFPAAGDDTRPVVQVAEAAVAVLPLAAASVEHATPQAAAQTAPQTEAVTASAPGPALAPPAGQPLQAAAVAAAHWGAGLGSTDQPAGAPAATPVITASLTAAPSPGGFDARAMPPVSSLLLLAIIAALSGLLLAAAGTNLRLPSQRAARTAQGDSLPAGPQISSPVSRPSRSEAPAGIAAVPYAPAPLERAIITPSPSQGAAPAGRPAATVLDAGITVEGELRTRGRLTIAGRVLGRVEAGDLVVLEGGRIDGEIVCHGTAEIAGALIGTITAGVLQVRAPGRIEGNIRASVLGIEAGAHVDADIRRRQAATVTATEPATVAPVQALARAA